MANVLVSGAGTEACNGLYIGSGTGQEAVYTGPNGYYIQYDGMGAWVLWDDAWNFLYVDDWMGNTNPWDAASWQVYMTGESPAPTVAEVSGFSISGTVELADETPVKTVKVTATASGESNVVVYTDENGDYTLENLADETTWRVTPTKLACTFSPTYHDVTLSGANQSGKDFTATEIGHDVSGTVADAGTGYVGAKVSATDGVNVVEATTTTGGAYTLENLPDDEWTITCTAGGRDVLWASRVITVNGAALDHVDFVALVPRGDVAVLGAGNADCTGAYDLVSGSGQTAVYNGPNGYILACYNISWNCWFIKNSGGTWQYDDGERGGGDGVSDPWLVETWYTGNGMSHGATPVPTVTQGGDTYAVTGTILDGSSNPVPGVLITATASGESDVTAYTGPDGKYAIGGLTDSTTWRLTPTKTDWTFTETYEDVAVSGADETDVDFVGEEEGGGEVSTTRAVEAWGMGIEVGVYPLRAWGATAASALRAIVGWGAARASVSRIVEAWGQGEIVSTIRRTIEAWAAEELSLLRSFTGWASVKASVSRTIEAWGTALDSTSLTRGLAAWGKGKPYPLYQQEFPPPPSFWPVVSFAGLNRVLCAEQYEGAFWLGAMGEDGAVLYRAEGGVVEPVPLPDGGSLGAVYGLTVHDDKLYALAGIRVWVNAPGELFGNWVLFGERPALPRGGGYWALQGEALYCFDGASWSRLYHQTGNTERFDLLGQAELYAAAAEPLAAWRQAAWRNLVTHTGPGMWVREAGAGVLGIAAHSHLAARAVAEPGLSGVLYRQEAGLVFSLPAGAVAGTACWHLGRVWCLREAGGRQYLSRAEVTGRLWQDLASWDVERAGYYWTMRSYRGQLLMYGAQMVLTDAPAEYGQGHYPVKLYPRRGRLSHSWLLLNEPEPRLIYRLSEGTPALAYLGGPEETLWIIAPSVGLGQSMAASGSPPFGGSGGGGVVQARVTLTDVEVLVATRAELATWGSAGWQYAGQTPHLALTHLGLELQGPCLFAVELEFADGLGEHEPRLDAAELEYTRRAFEPQLFAVELEFADGLGLHEPRADAVEVDFSDGWGEHEPRLDGVDLEYTALSREPRLEAVDLEYGRARPELDGDEVALIYEPLTPEEFPVNGVRVNVSLTHLERVKYCLVRAENGQAVDDWGSYEVFPPNTNYSLRETGEEYRLVIIGKGAPIRPLVRWNPD